MADDTENLNGADKVVAQSPRNGFETQFELRDMDILQYARVAALDVNGTIIVETDGQEYSVETEREGVAKEGSNRCVDINGASTAELTELTGIGEALAKAIIDERPFETLDDLTRVNGVGKGKLAGLKEQGLACVGE